MKLEGKIALVTGGSRGLGKVISKQLAAEGARVVVNYGRNPDPANETVEEIRKKDGVAIAVQADVTDEDSVDELLRAVQESYGENVDIVVNNASGSQPEYSLEENTWETYMDQLQFFVKAPLILTKAVLPGMKEKQFGRIINIGSEVVQLGNANFSNYVTAKSAMIGMTRSWANELGPHGINVNLVNPGFIPVERHGEVDPSTLEDYSSQLPLRRMGKPEDIANSVVFLSSDDSQFITGQSISVNGGNTFGI
ncbi:SDR family NAD(P)-dependent oxidoreductase [Halobacillus sp. K22]|uniref:SDR family NAD(P)-dependent oxidoreductase n=1 Tax=Halobacillus sp. K22 TaxID=3457431 RepID=UPI003FCC61E3